jgi:hypothetical protein
MIEVKTRATRNLTRTSRTVSGEIDRGRVDRESPDPSHLGKRLHPRVASWFQKTFPAFTQAQLLCVPAV